MHGGRLFDLITRHFLAVCSDDAIGFETVVTLECATETFTCKGSQQQPYPRGTHSRAAPNHGTRLRGTRCSRARVPRST